MWWVLGSLVFLYMSVGIFLFFRRARSGAGFQSLPPADVGPFLAVIALWPLYVRKGPASRRSSSDDACLSCGATIPTGAAACPACGWTWR
jgi:hypothetical protein